VNLSRWVHESKEHAGEDRDEVLLVVNVGQGHMRIDIVCERLVSNLGPHVSAKGCGVTVMRLNAPVASHTTRS
jgi:hypothetical protein